MAQNASWGPFPANTSPSLEPRFDVIPFDAEMPDRRAFAVAMARGCSLKEQVRARGGDVEALHIVLERAFGAAGRALLQAAPVEARHS